MQLSEAICAGAVPGATGVTKEIVHPLVAPGTAPAPHGTHGFTLIEILIAAVLLIIALVGSMGLVIGLLSGNKSTRARDTAYFIAQEALDQLAAVPIAQLPSTPILNVGSGTPSTPTPYGLPVCYAMGEDAFLDHALPANECTNPAAVNAPAAFYIRSEVCCQGPVVMSNTGQYQYAPAGSGCAALVPFSYNDGGIGGACIVQVEVTWPVEPTALTLANAFADSSTSPALSFQNHVVETMVRSQ